MRQEENWKEYKTYTKQEAKRLWNKTVYAIPWLWLDRWCWCMWIIVVALHWMCRRNVIQLLAEWWIYSSRIEVSIRYGFGVLCRTQPLHRSWYRPPDYCGFEIQNTEKTHTKRRKKIRKRCMTKRRSKKIKKVLCGLGISRPRDVVPLYLVRIMR